ncbi:MAG: hypothetical protein LC780_06740 [Acidobacteria bacterium]|nr:hypothetical protein [Acidobacteriota bacterium]
MISFAGGSLDPRRWRTLQNLVVVKAMSSSNDLAREIVEMYFAEEQELPPTVLITRAAANWPESWPSRAPRERTPTSLSAWA